MKTASGLKTKKKKSATRKPKPFLKEIPRGTFKSEKEFLELAGLWKGRKISLKEIRKIAWR
ncbi:MAG: hypothetical protein K1X63_02715 [Chitinophagales bacterium]|nr:hypothetical protein [Bacteroidota bacterium]MBX7139965.1 hypothetical protein [Chitinophagales bacterium]